MEEQILIQIGNDYKPNEVVDKVSTVLSDLGISISIKSETEEWEDGTIEYIVESNIVNKDTYLRLASDFENFKRRTNKEKEEYKVSSIQKIVLDILPTLDNFERAGVDKLDEGVKLIYTNLKNSLSKYGVTEIDTFEKDFDADSMEAITSFQAPFMQNKVVETIEKGYKINDKIIRFAKVVVGV